jgi:hypothetical protein
MTVLVTVQFSEKTPHNGKILNTGGITNMKIAYLDCFSGISGDMCLGALVDAGVSLKQLLGELEKIPLKGYEIRVRKVKRAGITATKADVVIEAKSKELRAESEETYSRERKAKSIPPQAEQGAKRWEDIEKVIHKSLLSKDIKEKGLKVFQRLFKAEAKIHGDTFGNVHLHELGAVDCLVDVFGTIIGLDFLGVEKVYASPINLGSGFIKTEHGILPVPAPASSEILKGVPVYSTDTNFELTTPTGAALVKELSSEFGSLPLMNIAHTGFGAGNMNFKDRPNVLRLFIGNLQSENLPIPPLNSPISKGGYRGVKRGELKGGSNLRNDNVPAIDRPRLSIGNPPTLPLEKLHPPSPLWQRGVRGDLKEGLVNLFDAQATVIEANIDDMNPQIYEYVMEKLFKQGALDVFLTQVIMKKGRPGIKLTVLCKEKEKEELIKTILTETTSIGLRFYDVERRVLRREIKLINTEFGKVRVKFSSLGDSILKATPEYEDCKRIAKKLKMPLIEVMRRIGVPVIK